MSTTLYDYQRFTKSTNKCHERWQRIHLIAGLQAEVGEVSEIIQKLYRDVLSDVSLSQNEVSLQADIARKKIKDELGDVLWYVSELARDFEISLDTIVEDNIEKLKKRHNK